MKCNSCGKRVNASLKFCENCGTPVPKSSSEQTAKSTQPAPSAEKSRAVKSNVASVELEGWRPWSWLFSQKYGRLSIADDHLEFELEPAWAFGIWRILAKLTSWGFDWLSFARSTGQAQLKNIAVASLISPEWIIWRFNFLVILGPGYVGIYPVSQTSVASVQDFVATLKTKTTEAKYSVERTK